MRKYGKYLVAFSLNALFAFTCIGAMGQNVSEETSYYLDSLIMAVNRMPDDIDKLALLNKICLKHYSVDSTLKYASIQLELADRLHKDEYVARADRFLGWCFLQKDKYEQLCYHYQKAILVFDSLSMTKLKAESYYGLGSSFCSLGDDTKGDECYEKALLAFESIGLFSRMAEVYRQMSFIRSEYHLYESSRNYLDKAFALDAKRGDSVFLGEDYFTLGWIYQKQYKSSDDTDYLFLAIKEMKRGYEMMAKYDDVYNLYWATNNLMYVYHDLAKIQRGRDRDVMLDSARCFYNMTKDLIDVCDIQNQNVLLRIWEAEDFAIRGNVSQTLEIIKEIEGQVLLDYDCKLYFYDAAIYAYESFGDYANALKYTKLLYHIDMENYNRVFAVQATGLEFNNELSQIRKEKQHQEYVLLIMKLSICMVSMIVVVFLLGFLHKRRLNEKLALQNDEIVVKNDELDVINAEILSQRDKIKIQRDNLEATTSKLMSSINYARRIQKVAVTSLDTMQRMFGDTLIYWKPMNVVSGDFYWAMQKDNFKLLALADCTGHGVPGAFMSMFAISSLNSIVSPLRFSNINASDVLDMLRAKIIGELHQTTASGDSIDSVDMAFCIIDTNKMQMQYAGANRPLLIVRDGKVNVYKPDKMPVGLSHLNNDPFANNLIYLKKNDVIYLYTDGITDQFGAEGDNATGKFATRRLDNLLMKISDNPFAEQYEIVDKAMNDWRTRLDGTLIEQYDDQLLLGIRIS